MVLVCGDLGFVVLVTVAVLVVLVVPIATVVTGVLVDV